MISLNCFQGVKKFALLCGVELDFTPKELEVLRLLCKGLNTSEIALKLGNSFYTIETYRKLLLYKSGCKNMVHLSHEATVQGLIKKASL